MEVVMILTTVVLGILGLMMQYFNVNRFLDFFHLLIASSIGLILLSSLDEGSGIFISFISRQFGPFISRRTAAFTNYPPLK